MAHQQHDDQLAIWSARSTTALILRLARRFWARATALLRALVLLADWAVTRITSRCTCRFKRRRRREKTIGS